MYTAGHLASPRGDQDANATRVHRDTRAWFTRRAAQAARDELSPLLETARRLDLDDPQAVASLRERAHKTTKRLVAAGHLPPSSIIDPLDSGLVVIRALSVAWQRVTPPPTERSRDR